MSTKNEQHEEPKGKAIIVILWILLIFPAFAGLFLILLSMVLKGIGFFLTLDFDKSRREFRNLYHYFDKK